LTPDDAFLQAIIKSPDKSPRPELEAAKQGLTP
jgi:hypothetical protein